MIAAGLALTWIMLMLVAFAVQEVLNDIEKKKAVLRWVDEREAYQRRVNEAVQNLRSLGAVEHVGAIDGMWTDGRFGRSGPRTFVPSATGLRQIELAMNILQEREGLIQQMRDSVVGAYGRLANWEKTHPMPDIGADYTAPPRLRKVVEEQSPRKQDTKPVPRFALDTPIYNKELTR